MSQTLEHLFLKIRLTQQPTSPPTTTLSLLLSVRRLITDLVPLLRLSSQAMVERAVSIAAAIWRTVSRLSEAAGKRTALFQEKMGTALSHRNTLYKKCAFIGIQVCLTPKRKRTWMPAFAGTT